jgi:hypothetical protein
VQRNAIGSGRRDPRALARGTQVRRHCPLRRAAARHLPRCAEEDPPRGFSRGHRPRLLFRGAVHRPAETCFDVAAGADENSSADLVSSAPLSGPESSEADALRRFILHARASTSQGLEETCHNGRYAVAGCLARRARDTRYRKLPHPGGTKGTVIL